MPASYAFAIVGHFFKFHHGRRSSDHEDHFFRSFRAAYGAHRGSLRSLSLLPMPMT